MPQPITLRYCLGSLSFITQLKEVHKVVFKIAPEVAYGKFSPKAIDPSNSDAAAAEDIASDTVMCRGKHTGYHLPLFSCSWPVMMAVGLAVVLLHRKSSSSRFVCKFSTVTSRSSADSRFV